MKKIFILPYCHPDWAWTHTRKWHENRYCLVLNEVLDIMNEFSNFRYYIDAYITFLEPFLRNYPERFDELKKRVKEGKIAICGTYTNLRVNMVGEETFIRDIIIGRRIFKELFPEAELSVYAGNVDVAVGHPQIPQILKLSGYKYFRFGRPHDALSTKNIPYEFIWEGIDGSKIISSRGSYSGLCYREIFTEKDKFLKNWEKAVERFKELELKYASKISKTGIIWISQGMDDLRPLRSTYPEDVKLDLIEFFEEWNKREKIPIFWANPVDYFKEIENEKLPVIKGTIDPCDVCYNASYGGSSGLWYLRIIVEREILNAEKLSAIASEYGFKYPYEEFEKLWKNLLLFSSHATQWLFQDDFDEIYNLAINTKLNAEGIKISAINHIISCIKYDKKPVAIVFNLTNFSSYFYVKFFISSVDKKLDKNFVLFDLNGEKIQYQIINYLPSEYDIWEVNVLAKVFIPSFGYNLIYLEKEKIEEKYENIRISDLYLLENDKISIKFHNGKIIEIKVEGFDYKTDNDLPFVDLKIVHIDPLGTLHIGKILGEEKVIWNNWYKKEDGDLRKIFSCSGKIGKHDILMDTIIYKGQERIDFNVEIDWYGEENAFVLFSLFFGFFDGEIYADIPFTIEKKEIEKEKYGRLPGKAWANIERLIEGMFFAKSFVDFSNGKNKISLICHNGDRYFIFDKERKVLSHITLRSFKRPNTWEKDINEKIEAKGKHKFLYSIFFNKEEVYKLSEILRNNPVIIERFPKKSIQKIEKNSFISVKPERVIITGFYKEDEFYILRLYEPEGKEKEIEISLFFDISQTEPIDLIGNKIEKEIKVEKSKIKTKIKKFEILTLKITPLC